MSAWGTLVQTCKPSRPSPKAWSHPPPRRRTPLSPRPGARLECPPFRTPWTPPAAPRAAWIRSSPMHQRLWHVGLLAALLLAGCSRKRPAALPVDTEDDGKDKGKVVAVVGDGLPASRPAGPAPEVVATLPEATRQ